MADIYANVCDLTEPNKEVVYDCPTGVEGGEDEIAARRVEMTLNPAYETLTCSKEHVSINNHQYETPISDSISCL